MCAKKGKNIHHITYTIIYLNYKPSLEQYKWFNTKSFNNLPGEMMPASKTKLADIFLAFFIMIIL